MVGIECAAMVGGVSIIIVALGYGYKIKADKKSIQLEKNDQQHEQRHYHNEQRIKQLEEKNGHEQHQIDELKAELAVEKKDKSELKDLVIKLQNRILNCEKTNGHKSVNNPNTPPPPPPPKPEKEPKKEPENKKEVNKSHNEVLKEALAKRRKKIEEEE